MRSHGSSSINKVSKVLTLAITLMLVGGFMVSSNTEAASGPELMELAVNFLEDVAGIDMENYVIIRFDFDTKTAEENYRGNYAYTSMTITFSRYTARIKMVDGKVYSYDLYHTYGTTLEPDKILTDVNIEEPTVSDYAERLGSSFDGYEQHFSVDNSEIHDSLAIAKSTGESPVESGSWRLFIDTEHEKDGYEFVKFSWRVFVNDIRTGRSISLTMTESGVITSLYDKRVYYIATAEVSISKEEAIEIATPYAQEYADKYGSKIIGTDAALRFVTDSSSDDDFALYPTYGIHFVFYGAGANTCGYSVYIWGHDGEVYRSGITGSMSCNPPSPTPGYVLFNYILPVILLIISLGVVSGIAYRIWDKRKRDMG